MRDIAVWPSSAELNAVSRPGRTAIAGARNRSIATLAGVPRAVRRRLRQRGFRAPRPCRSTRTMTVGPAQP
eukprot:12512970-Alexandrium_andersonii.AAC.1